ncbi:hypothetical protein [Xanthomonas albilineans]|uniref:Uncharacterized protein n=1 Tax=Xanthomonas albilineans (strain GPE PC73 / CFBP 7063) TaxID=380358 RepID=D2U9E1_XANAP|nr:hypothetical protein [Xanthomonas albilineans]CBA16883.1 hypothetical protein XALC_2403 [Xanthomonas albilineans GPE PC73]
MAGLNIAITLGRSRSRSQSEQHSDISKGSTLHACVNVNLIATSGGEDSNLLIQRPQGVQHPAVGSRPRHHGGVGTGQQRTAQPQQER